MPFHRAFLAGGLLVLGVFLALPLAAATVGLSAPSASVDPAVSMQLRFDDSVAVIIALKPESAVFSSAVISPLASGSDASSDSLNVTRRFDSLDLVSADLDSRGLEALRRDPSVAAVFYDRPVHAMDAASNAQINADDVQRFVFNGQNVTGRNQTVCIIDTGIDYRDPAFGTCGSVGSGGNCRVVGGYDFVNGDADPLDDHGHGTHVSGIAAANGSGFVGVAPGASIVSLKVLNAQGTGSLSNLIAGIDWCTNNRTLYNITVISMSLGGGLFSSACDSEPAAVAVQSAFSSGLFVSAASGNDGSTSQISSPACASNATAVGAVNSADAVADFSNNWGNFLLLAPGVNINSTVRNNGSSVLSGTSMATPHVSGAVALLQDFAQRGNGTLAAPTYLRSLLNRTGVAVTDTRTGANNAVHYRVDALAALQAFQADVSPRSIALASFANGSATDQSYSEVNVSFFDDNLTASVCILQWSNGSSTNFSMLRGVGSCQFNVTGQGNVNATFQVFINDSFGNLGIASFVRSQDTLAPQQVNSTFANNSVLANTSVIINATFSDLNPHSCILQLDGVNTSLLANAGSCLFNRSVAEGNHGFTVFVNDSFGRVNQSGLFSFTTDLSPPTALTFVTPTAANGSSSRNTFVFVNLSFVEPRPSACVLQFNASFNHSMTLFGSNGPSPYCEFNVTNLPEGGHNYSVFLNDTVGFGNVTSLLFTVLDRTPPAVTAVSVRRFMNRSSAFNVSANASDALAPVLNVSVAFTNGSGVALYSQSFSLLGTFNYTALFADASALSDGNYTLNVTALDNASNAASNASINITIDTVAPSAPVLSIAANASGFVFINWSASIDAVALDYYDVFRNGTRIASTSALNVTDLTAIFGSFYNYTIFAYDVAGNANASNSISALANDTLNPASTANVSAANLPSGAVNLSWFNVTLDVNGSTERNVTFRIFRTTATSSTDLAGMSELATVYALAYQDGSALSASTTYLYVVASVDANGNVNTSVTANNSVNHTTVSACTNAFSDFSACSGSSQSRTRTCLGRTETQTQACSSGVSGSSGGAGGSSGGSPSASAGGGGASTGASSGGARGGGGGGGGSGKDLFIVQNIPASLVLEPGKRKTVDAEVSSFYTGFLRVRNVTVSGVPDDWYTVNDLSLVSPISKTPFSIDWHPPAEARGNYSVRLDIIGVGTRNAGLLKTSFQFQLVLPPAESVKSSATEQVAPVLQTQTRPTPTVQSLPQPARTDYVTPLFLLAGMMLLGVVGAWVERWKWRKAHGQHGKQTAEAAVEGKNQKR